MNTLEITPDTVAAASPLRGLIGPCLRGAVFVALLTGLVYPLLTTGVAQMLMPRQAGGSLIERGSALIGSDLIGQHFSDARHFHPRPSATSAPDPQDASKTVAAPYNAALSAGSNQGPTNQALIDAVTQRVADYRKTNGLGSTAPVPVDAVTASASGLDPHISVANAQAQVGRVAKARGIPLEQVQQFLSQHTEGRVLGLLGEPCVNVLRLNLALNAAFPGVQQAQPATK